MRTAMCWMLLRGTGPMGRARRDWARGRWSVRAHADDDRSVVDGLAGSRGADHAVEGLQVGLDRGLVVARELVVDLRLDEAHEALHVHPEQGGVALARLVEGRGEARRLGEGVAGGGIEDGLHE